MSQKWLVGWALGATLIAVGALGFIAGKRAGPGGAPAMLPASTGSTVPGGGAAPQPIYTIPDALQGMPTEWRSRIDASVTGVAALFHPTDRRVILERCEHHRYEGDLLDGMKCDELLRGQLASLEERQATLLNRAGQPVAVRLNLNTDTSPPTLRLRFDGEDITLIPGRRNDMLQAMEAQPAIQQKKAAYLRKMMSGRPAPSPQPGQ